MSANSFGSLFRVTTFGESHGPAIGAVVDGVPPNLELNETDIQRELDRRRPGQSSVSTPRSESDTVEILSGVFNGRTMGPPVAMLIRNRNQNSTAYDDIKMKFRPGHADYGYTVKYGLRDWRGGGRASGRETACRVAAGAIAKKVLACHGIQITGFAARIGPVAAQGIDYAVIEKNIVRTADAEAADAMIAAIESAKANGNSLGGIVELHVNSVPAGLGDPVFDKLEAVIAHALMSVGAVKGIEFGAGFASAAMSGKEYNDEFFMDGGQVKTRTNNCGGIIGGISTGNRITIRMAIRPTGSISIEQQTVDIQHNATAIETHGRHDPCIVPRVIPVLEAMAAIALADALLQQLAYGHFRCSQEEGIDFVRES